LQHFELEWNGLRLSETQKKIWVGATISMQQRMHETKTMILKEQLTELKAQLAETKILSIKNKLF
jgi:hypothetical protein